MKNECVLTRKGFQWARTGHPWVYRDDVGRAAGEDGEVVRVSYEGKTLGSAFLGTRSKIALRWIERSAEPAEPDDAFWRARIEVAYARRGALAKRTDAYRVVHDAADGVPGLIADRYGPVAVVQTTTAGAERLLGFLGAELPRILGVRSVIARNDVSIREKEGLPREVRVIAGEPPEKVWVNEEGPAGKVEFAVDPRGGQKTGAYLDQRENRWRTAELAKGRFLDAFSHSGLFGLHAARRAAEVIAVDTSEPALAACEETAAANRFSNVKTIHANVFDYLKEARGREEKFDAVVLDPPAFAKSRAEVPAAVRGYKEINRRAMELLDRGGLLVTCSCSYNLSEADFIDVLRDASADARRDFRIIERRGQASDHPVILCHPESAYLKCVVMERL